MNYGPRIGESVVDPDPNRIRTAGTSIPDTYRCGSGSPQIKIGEKAKLTDKKITVVIQNLLHVLLCLYRFQFTKNNIKWFKNTIFNSFFFAPTDDLAV